jgi:glycosyltransferase involved in cell wall biosynthesis
MSPIRVAMIGPYPLSGFYGGVGKHVYNLANHIADANDVELHVIMLGSQAQQFINNGIQFHVIHQSSIRYALPFDSIKVINLIAKIKPDIVHIQATSFPNSLTSIIVNRKYSKVVSIHGLIRDELRFQRRFYFVINRFIGVPLEKYAISKSLNVIVMTPYDKASVLEINANANVYVLPAGVEDKFFSVKAQEKPNHLLFVGPISPRKGLLDLLKAMTTVVKEIPTVRLDIVGSVVDKNHFNMLVDYVKDNGLEKTVSFRGYLSEEELSRKYGETTLFVFPSYEESQGLVLLEAMACGKPVIASNVGGIPYVVNDQVNGLLFQCGNVDELVQKIILLLKDEGLRRQLKEAARERAVEFSWSEIAKRTIAIYKKMSPE